MQPIVGYLYSPFQKKVQKFGIGTGFDFNFKTEIKWERTDATVSRIRRGEGYPVSTFKQLVEEVAIVTINNKNYEMFYRGQTNDYKNNNADYFKNNEPKTTIYPTICRPEKKSDGTSKYSIKKKNIIERYDNLTKMINIVRGSDSTLLNEYYYALFQHYDILPTPLIDITQSLRVAATFALEKSTKGYVYVFGMPYPNQSISYFLDLGIVLIKLQNIMEIEAKKPRYQEGFLVGKFPIRPTKTNGDELANRMVAKFLVDNTDNKFWDEDFKPIPKEVLHPKNDEVERRLLKHKEQFYKTR